jgi:hypothetical protein
METPPPYMPPRKKSSTGLVVGIVLGVVALCCIGGAVLIGGLGYMGIKAGGPMVECMVGFEQLRQAMDLYIKENDGKLPKAETWQDDLRPYFARTQKAGDGAGPFKEWDPQGDWGCQNGNNRTGIAFNDRLSGKKVDDIEDKSTVVLFEVEGARKNAHEPYQPRDDKKSPEIMGTPRGWIKMPLEGEIIMHPPSGGRRRTSRTSDSNE